MTLVHTATDEPCTTLSLPHRPESVATAREAMAEELRASGLDEALVLDAQIVLAELAANAVEHGRPNDAASYEVSWCLVGDHLRISVIDGGHAPDLSPGRLDTESLRGRGLAMVDTLCDRWTADAEIGTRVTAELRV